MKFDDLLTDIGEFGPYQKRVFFLTAIPTLLGAFEAISVIFTFNIPQHRCAIPGFPEDQYHVTNDTHALLLQRSLPKDDGKWSQCQVYSDVINREVISSGLLANDSESTSQGLTGNMSIRGNVNVSSCQRWVYEQSVFETTIATDFDIVCDRSVLRASSNMIAEMGCLFGTFVCGFVADRFGRKVPFYISGLATIGGGFGIAFTQDLTALNICRFILGMSRLALWINGIVIGMELVGPSHRVFVGIIMELLWCVGMLILLVFAYFVRSWRYLEIALSVPSLGLLVYWWLIPESPRWLVSRGRDNEAMVILEKIAASNKTSLPKMDNVATLLEVDNSFNFRHIFRSRELVICMVILFSNMFMLCVIYYALIFNITNLAGDIFINFLISVLLETVGYVSPYFLLDRFGRKPVYCVSILIAGAACVLSVVPDFFGAPDWVVISLSMVGRFFVCVCYAVIYIYGAELFPTIIRGSAMGVGVTFSRFGGFLSPYLADVGILVGGRLKEALPLIVMGSPALLMGLLSLWLPETKGIKLPETMDDLHYVRRKRSFMCCGKGERNTREATVSGDATDTVTSPV